MKSQLARFSTVGVLNTVVDFVLFAVLTNVLGLHYIFANTISTGAALSLSFFLNGKVTFRSKLNGKSALLFLATTLTGLWLLQPIIITLSEPLLRPVLVTVSLGDASVLAAKVIATLFSLTWNYVLYRYVVFPNADTSPRR